MLVLRKIRGAARRVRRLVNRIKLRLLCRKRGINMVGAKLHCDNFSNLIMGSNICINDAFLDLHDTITIEDNVGFGHQVKVLTGTHDYRKFLGERAKVISKPVHIRKGVWVASFAIILPGTEIGEHSVVAAGSVVRGKVPPYSLVAGNPASVVRSIDPNGELE